MESGDAIFVAGSTSLIGAAIVRRLRAQGFNQIIGCGEDEPDYTDAAAIETFFAHTHPQYVFLTAGQSGGIAANQRFPARLMRDNLLAATNLIDAAHRHHVAKLLYLGSSCMYPRHCAQPMQEKDLLTGPLEPTNEAYALAKIAGMKLCQAYRVEFGSRFITAIPANAFGVDDHFDPEDSHVIPGLIHRMHEAKESSQPEVVVWGTGKARREFIFADDLADACVLVMRAYEDTAPINLGGGEDVTIVHLAEMIRATVGYTGRLRFDTTKPDGMPLKSLESSRLLALGWRPRVGLQEGIEKTYRAMLGQFSQVGDDHV